MPRSYKSRLSVRAKVKVEKYQTAIVIRLLSRNQYKITRSSVVDGDSIYKPFDATEVQNSTFSIHPMHRSS